ncbi:MAG: HU family DNA-binding protein [Thiotrichaceae bacterium]|nr:HU family DNA-binding protein [Thiotrichaceae bacterium]
MNKKELISAISTNLQIADAEAQRFVDSFQSIITETLSDGGEISLVGFGRFHTKQQRARIGRNPATGEPMKIPAKLLPAFTPGKTLKETIRGTV